jgi:hypothetical protein
VLGSAAPALALGAGDGFVATLWGAWDVQEALDANRLADDAGARQISYLVHMRQADRRSNEVRWQDASPDTPFANAPGAAALDGAIADARARGLAVTLVPFLMADSGQKRHWFWPRDRQAWFRSYGRHVRELAAFGEARGVTELLVGSELSLLYWDALRWRELIRGVRGVFSGHLTISTIFYEYRTIQFWDALDSIGVSAYFPLAVWSGTRSTWILERVWELHRAHLVAFAASRGKPLTFCEVGYPTTHVAAIRPWDWEWSKRSRDPELQARCFDAFRRVWSREPLLRRFSIWGLSSSANDIRFTDGKGFLPLGKPAERHVRAALADRARP